jgi:hypothetical protein
MEAIINSTNDSVVANDIQLIGGTTSTSLNIPAQLSMSITAEAEANTTGKEVKVDSIQAVTAMKELEQITTDRQVWQDTAYKTSNDMLYGILERCYAYYHKMSGESDAAQSAREGFKLYVHSRDLKFKKSTHTIAKVLACVFGIDRRRVSAYSIALRSALQNNVKTSDLIEYLANAGGVEELRLAKSPNAMTVKTKAATATSWVSGYELATVKSEQLSMNLDSANVGSQHVLLVTQCADGSFTVHGIVSNTGVVDAALAAFYTKHKSSKATETAATEVADTQADLNALIATAAAETHQ